MRTLTRSASEDGPPCRGIPWSRLKSARANAGIRHASADGLRHSFALPARANGVPDAPVAKLLGQRGTAILHHGAHLAARPTAPRDALEGGKVDDRDGMADRCQPAH